jgi:hypothetical protein
MALRKSLAMPDGSLFPDLVDAPTPRDGFARHPIGRRRNPRPSPARRGPPSRLVEALRRVERALEAQSVVALDLSATVERLGGELRIAAHERRQTNERIDQLQRLLVELRRALGLSDLHCPPRSSRRRPVQ